MPNIYFYAVRDDADNVLQALFDEKRLEVWQSYSRFGESLTRFVTPGDAISYLHDKPHTAQFRLHSATFGAPILIRELTAAGSPVDVTHRRFVAEGWGVFTLNFSIATGSNLDESNIGVNSEARAKTWRDTLHDELGEPSAWDWVAIRREYAFLNRLIARLSVARVQGAHVLPYAYAQIVRSGARISRDVSLLVPTQR